MFTAAPLDAGSCVVPADAAKVSDEPQLRVFHSAPLPETMYSDLPTTVLSAAVAVLLARMVAPQAAVTVNPLVPPSWE